MSDVRLQILPPSDGGAGLSAPQFAEGLEAPVALLGDDDAPGPNLGFQDGAALQAIVDSSTDGDDEIVGTPLDDVLGGGAGRDVIDALAGDDIVTATSGDTARGGAGDDRIVVEGGDEGPTTVDGGTGSDAVVIRAGGVVGSALSLGEGDRVSIESGGKLGAPIDWATDGNIVVENAGLIDAPQIVTNVAGVAGSLVLDNLATGTFLGAIVPNRAGDPNAVVTINNSGLIEATGRVIDFRSFDAKGGSGVVNNLADGIIRQVGTNTDVIRPGVEGVVNNWGTITTDAAFVGGGDLIDFQSDRGGVVNNYASGRMEGARHVVTGDFAVTVFNEGAMIASNGAAVNIDNDGSVENTVRITNLGVMEGRSGELGNSDGDAIDVDGLATITNSGRIAGLGHEGANDGEPNISEAIAIGGGSIVNQAGSEIYGYGRAIQIDNSNYGPAFARAVILNDGLIEGAGNGPEGVSAAAAAAFDLRGNEAIHLIGSLDDEIVNRSTGRIIGGVSMGGGNDRLGNSGLIAAIGGSAIDMGAGEDVVNLSAGSRVEGTLLLGAGDDRLVARGPGDLEVFGEGGNDVIFAGDGDDRASGGDDNDTISGGAGNDILHGDAGNDILHGDAGNDNIDGGTGRDNIDGGTGRDNIDGGIGDDTINGGADDDVLNGGDGNDYIYGGTGNDFATGGAGNDTIDGADGADNLHGADGNDTISGGNGRDFLSGGAGDDILLGGNDSDELVGGTGLNHLYGGAGSDILVGGTDVDKLFGGDGNDLLFGNLGRDFMLGGAGDDVFQFRTVQDSAVGGLRDRIFDFTQGQDKIDVSAIDSDVGLGVSNGNNSFDFMGTGGFTDAGQIRYTIASNGTTVVQFNTDGDLTTAEFEIELNETSVNLTFNDFIL